MESFFSTVKSELREHFDSNGEAKMELFDYIEAFYNQRRRHSSSARSGRPPSSDAWRRRAWTLPSLGTRKTRPRVTWNTAQSAVFHSAHTHCRVHERKKKRETQPT